MPIYEYQCKSCGHELEALQKMAETPLTECPQCHQPKLTKLISAAGFQLKGSGWYVTDYSKKGKSKQAQEESGSGTAATTSDTKSDTNATKSTESKPADNKASEKKASEKNANEKKANTTSDAVKSNQSGEK